MGFPLLLLSSGQSSTPPITDKTGAMDLPVGMLGKVSGFFDPSLGEPGKQLALQLVENSADPYRHMEVFFGIQGDPVYAVLVPNSDFHDGSGGAGHQSGGFGLGDGKAGNPSGGKLYLDAAFASVAPPPLDLEMALFIAELSECFMGKQNAGWAGGGGNGEALSRFLAEHETPVGTMDMYATARAWADAGRPDYINVDINNDKTPESTGCGVVYLYWMLSLGFTIPQIVQAGGATLQANYAKLTGRLNGYGDLNNALGGSAITSDNPFSNRMPAFGNACGLAMTATGESRAIFSLGVDGAVWRVGRGGAGQPWSPWESLGQAGGGFVSDPAVAIDRYGRFHVFVRGKDNALWRKTWTGKAWLSWTSLGGRFQGDPAAVDTSAGVKVFALGVDNVMYRFDDIFAQPPAASLFGGYLSGGPSIARNADGRLELFACGQDNTLWHAWETTPGGDWSAWVSGHVAPTSNPSVAMDSTGKLQIFFKGLDNALWHVWQTAGSEGPWSAPLLLGAKTIVGDPLALTNRYGQIEVFCRGTDRGLWHIWQLTPGQDLWSEWQSLGGLNTGDPVGALTSDGGLEVYARGSDYALWQVSQSSPGQTWSQWASLSGHLPNRPLT